MKAFVTGGTGFIGSHVIRQLVERGYEVTALARSEQGAAAVAALGATPVIGDVTDMESMRPGMTGSDVVFHIAAWYKIGSADWQSAESINVGGTRKVLRLAQELAIPRVVHTSTVGVFSDTKGQLVDETYYNEGPFVSEYERTKWLAHYKVAMPLIEKGAPIIIVMPGVVYGPGDPSPSSVLMRQFQQSGMPVLPGPETTFTFAHVDDIAAGHILAAEKGQIGETYILAGPAVPLGEMVDFWAYLTGKPKPIIRIPAALLRPLAPIVGFLRSFLPLPPIINEESLSSMGVTYMARADKARAQLGWQTRSLHEGMSETLAYEAKMAPPAQPLGVRERAIIGGTVGAIAALLFVWYWTSSQRRRQARRLRR
jgi:dihydroflavonol-4-reductase